MGARCAPLPAPSRVAGEPVGAYSVRAAFTNLSASTGVNVNASTNEVSNATLIVKAKDRKKTPVTPVSNANGKNTTTGVIVDPTIGAVISLIAACTASTRDSPRATCV